MTETDLRSRPRDQSRSLKGIREQRGVGGGAWECENGRQGGWREERPKREIVTTELVAGADFFHHLPCAGRKTTIGGLGESQS